MTIETSLYAALKSLVDEHVYRIIATDKESHILPRITFQAVGGESINFLDSATLPNKRFQRVQVNVWHSRYDDAMLIARQAEAALKSDLSLQTTVLGEPVALMEGEGVSRIYGSMQDFNVFG